MTTADYREGDLEAPTPDHVDRWIRQFTKDVQVPILHEMNHVLEKMYCSKKDTRRFLKNILESTKLVGDDPCAFWRDVSFLDIQNDGNSQKEMLALFSKLLYRKCHIDIANRVSESHTFIYLDDGVFTGNRIKGDIERWITNDAPPRANLHIITIASHTNGYYYAEGGIIESAKEAEKNIRLSWWRAISMKNKRAEKDMSDVLWPTTLPDDDATKEYVDNMYYKPLYRSPGHVGDVAIFSSDAGRILLEQEFFKAGVSIRRECPNLGPTQRPLGHATLETLGFGSLFVTFRNCPNNTPLALWAGDPWYPLFPRITNTQAMVRRSMPASITGRW